MSTRDLLLAELYHTPRDAQAQALAARHAPLLYFDANEPFLPLAAGYTIFHQDEPSPSFKRTVKLRLTGELSPFNEPGPFREPALTQQAPAALAIEYAIWWDWDIHHLYELEHAWVYLDARGIPLRVEASWHGKFYHIPLKLEDGHPVLLSEPGKHAFAPDPSWFHQRVRDYRRVETRAVGMHAHVLINSMFTGKIRHRVFDRVLARSYLQQHAFDPTWSFTQRFAFDNEWLVPWPALHDWIPQRVNAVLERLENITWPEEYRALRLVSAEGTLGGLQEAAATGADAVIAPLSLRENRLVLGNGNLPEPIGLDEALEFCKHEPISAFLELDDPETVDRLAWFIRSNDLNNHVVIVSPDAGLLARYGSFITNGMTAIQITAPDQDPIRAAQQCGATYVHLRREALPAAAPVPAAEFDPAWIQRVHDAGLGIISWPEANPDESQILQQLGLDVIWEKISGHG